MQQKEVKNLISILERSYKAILEKDIKTIRELSGHTVHSMAITQDYYSISTAVILYSLSKIFERDYYKHKGWNDFYKNVRFFFKKSIQSLKQNNLEEYKKHVKKILFTINNLDKKLKIYIGDVVENSKISKASRIHEHGVSIGKTAELLGISKWDVMEYVGKTGIPDVKLSKTISAKERLKNAREVFNG